MRYKTVLVTGGGRGIGFAICRAIAQEGGNVAAVDALPEPVEEFHSLSSKYAIKTSYAPGDVTDQHSLENAFVSATEAVGGELQGCVPAAGIAIDKPFFDHEFQESKRLLEVNTLGTFWTVRLAAERMKQANKGSIVMIASIAAQGIAVPRQNISIYNMSKAAVKGLAGPLAVELAQYGIRVNTISPGFIESPMTNSLREINPELFNTFKDAAPLKRIGQTHDLTPAVVYLLSDASAFTTGADLPITGGLHAGTSKERV